MLKPKKSNFDKTQILKKKRTIKKIKLLPHSKSQTYRTQKLRLWDNN